MRVLGIADGQTSGAAIVEDGRIIAAVKEERIARIKLARGFPWKSIDYHRIIDEYRRRTGVPVIINTSFNIHEEPIVRSPEDAVRAFLDSALDYLAIGNYLVAGPVGSVTKWGHATHLATSR